VRSAACKATAIVLIALVAGCPADDEGADPTPGDEGASGMSASAPDAGPAAPADSGPVESLAERPCPEQGELAELSYESFGAPFFLSYCQGCHGSARAEGQRQGAPVAIAFDDAAAIRQHAERIWARAADQNATMPPVGGPPSREREKLGAWLACGARLRAEL
jgi:mono/diheme cytochrome c family protein